jgi:hypothetical protein
MLSVDPSNVKEFKTFNRENLLEFKLYIFYCCSVILWDSVEKKLTMMVLIFENKAGIV